MRVRGGYLALCIMAAPAALVPAALADPGQANDRQVEVELLNQMMDRELASASAPPSVPSPGVPSMAPEPTDAAWSLESPNMPIGAAQVYYKTSRLDAAHGVQSIRFRIENPNIERAAIAFDVDLVSGRGQHYHNVVGAIVEPGRDLTGPELDLLPFEAGDPIAFVRILRPMVCAEPPVALPETGPHQDDCLPVHAERHASN